MRLALVARPGNRRTVTPLTCSTPAGSSLLPGDVVARAGREDLDLGVPREAFGDVARVQLGAAVDVRAVALDDDRELHESESAALAGIAPALARRRGALVSCPRRGWWRPPGAVVRGAASALARRPRRRLGAASAPSSAARRPRGASRARRSSVRSTRSRVAGPGPERALSPSRVEGPLPPSAPLRPVARPAPSTPPPAPRTPFRLLGLGPRPLRPAALAPAAGGCSGGTAPAPVLHDPFERARAPLVEVEPARHRLDAHLEVLHLDAEPRQSRRTRLWITS